jgi:hypothetical protein
MAMSEEDRKFLEEHKDDDLSEPAPEPSYRERLARLEAEEEAAAKAEFEKRLAQKARQPIKVPFDAQRGASEPYRPAFHGLADRLRDPRTAFSSSTQEELKQAVEGRADWYRSNTDGR